MSLLRLGHEKIVTSVLLAQVYSSLLSFEGKQVAMSQVARWRDPYKKSWCLWSTARVALRPPVPTWVGLDAETPQLSLEMTAALANTRAKARGRLWVGVTRYKLHLDSWPTKSCAIINVCCLEATTFQGHLLHSNRKSTQLNEYVELNSLVIKTTSNCTTSKRHWSFVEKYKPSISNLIQWLYSL